MEDIPNKIVSVLGIMLEVNLLRQYEHFYIEINVAPSSVPVNYRGEYCYHPLRGHKWVITLLPGSFVLPGAVILLVYGSASSRRRADFHRSTHIASVVQQKPQPLSELRFLLCYLVDCTL